MSLTAESMTPADIAACTCGNNSGWGNGNFGEWIILFLIFGMFGWNNNGFFGNGGNAGAADNYVLASDFANIERKLDGVNNGLCDGFYAVNTAFGNLNNTLATNFAGVQNTLTQGFAGLNAANIQQGYENRIATNAIGSQLSQCCCDLKEGISGVNYNMAMNSNATQRAISDGFCQTNYNMATQNNATMVAIDKVGDRIIDYLANEKAQTLRDENQALRLAASQARQNEVLIDRLGPKCPTAAYVVQPPQQVTFPTNCCGGVNYANGGCGCNNF